MSEAVEAYVETGTKGTCRVYSCELPPTVTLAYLEPVHKGRLLAYCVNHGQARIAESEVYGLWSLAGPYPLVKEKDSESEAWDE